MAFHITYLRGIDHPAKQIIVPDEKPDFSSGPAATTRLPNNELDLKGLRIERELRKALGVREADGHKLYLVHGGWESGRHQPLYHFVYKLLQAHRLEMVVGFAAAGRPIYPSLEAAAAEAEEALDG